ncbi:MAG: ATP-dependent DNA helicase, partial [Patescibacteria group bacterium]|nr:ATP-dependent DNA helicase [Patescibacteria group bacterium]
MEKTRNNKLNKEQEMAVKYGDGPLLIIAGAGTGKTAVITHRIAYLIKQKKAKPEEILGLTFTDKATQEMRDRVENLISENYAELWISTFHSFCDRLLRNYGLDIGLSTDFRLINPTQAWLLVYKNLDKFNLDYYKPLGDPTKFIHSLLKHFSRCKDEGILPESYLEYSDEARLNLDDVPVGSKAIKSKHKNELACAQQEADRIKEIANAYHTYQQILLKNNCLDFGDLINYCLKMFEQRPIILEKIKKQFKYILVDEFQDTNFTQYELVKQLCFPKNNIAVCADDDQSIYKFRGSCFNNVLQFRKDFSKTKEIVLKRNYRSCQNILDLSYKFIQFNNPNRLECFINQTANDFEKIDKKLLAKDNEQGIIQYLSFKTMEQEINGVVDKIMEFLDKDNLASFNDFAILCRTNQTANNFARALERANMPYQFLSSKGLYSRPIILDIISYFKLLNNYYESSSMYRLINMPCFNISTQDIAKISQYSYRKACSIYETLEQLPLISDISQENRQKINNILDLIKKHSKSAKEKNISEIFVIFLQDSGYLEYLVKKQKPDMARESLDLISQFYDKIKQFEQEQINSKLRDFVEQIDMEIQSGEEGAIETNPEKGPETIKILTVHSAKGLEFKYVFLVNLVDQKFPTRNKKEPIEIPEKLVKQEVVEGDIHLQEERRLFYVAMTRAKKALFFTSAKEYGTKRDKKPSRFLIECELEPIEKEQKNNLKIINVKKKKNNFSKQLSIPKHFSFTQLMAFEKCPLQYKFAHILKIPIKGKPSFTFGRTIHNTLHEFVNKLTRNQNLSQTSLFAKTNNKDKKFVDKKNRFNELLEIYKQNWKDEWYDSKEQKQKYYKKGKKLLKVFYNDFVKNNPKIKIIQDNPALEQSFNLKIGDYNIRGKIDRIDELGDGVKIIDYKTGAMKEKLLTPKGKPRKVQPKNKEQLLIYQIAAQEVFNLKPKELCFHYLEDNKNVCFLGTEEEIKSIKEKII